MSEITLPPTSKPKSAKRGYVRPYKKSINGCKTCKSRKVKCDEAKPICGNCQRRFMNATCCEYPRALGEKSSNRTILQRDSGLITTSLPRPISIVPFEAAPTNLLELRLMHNYTISTTGRKSFYASATWDIDIPQMAFSSKTILNILLAISAQNLVSKNPNDHEARMASNHYFQKSIILHREALSCITIKTAREQLIAGMMLSYHIWLAAHARDSPDGYDFTLQVYRMCNGLIGLFSEFGTSLPVRDYTPPNMNDNLRNNNFQYPSFMDSALVDTEILLKLLGPNLINIQDRDACEKAAVRVLWITSSVALGYIADPIIEQEVVTMLHSVPPHFVKLLEKHEPLAIAIAARNICLLELLRDKTAWWVHGTGYYPVAKKAVETMYDLMPPELQWTMEWPKKIVNCGPSILNQMHSTTPTNKVEWIKTIMSLPLGGCHVPMRDYTGDFSRLENHGIQSQLIQ